MEFHYNDRRIVFFSNPLESFVSFIERIHRQPELVHLFQELRDKNSDR